MSDQFSEWDRFYAAYESTLTPGAAMQRYKHRRKKAERRAATAKMKRTIAAKRALNSSTPEKSAEDAASQMMPWVIVEEP